VTFLHDVFTCCYLLHNLLKFEYEASFAWLFRIIDLEIGVHEEGHHRVGKEPHESGMNWRSEKIWKFVIWRELTLYLGRQRNFQWTTCEFVLPTFYHIRHVIKNVESCFPSMHFNSHNLLPCEFIPSSNFFHLLAFTWTMVDFVWCYSIFMVAKYFLDLVFTPKTQHPC
jgi:hypothetical protein